MMLQRTGVTGSGVTGGGGYRCWVRAISPREGVVSQPFHKGGSERERESRDDPRDWEEEEEEEKERGGGGGRGG